MTLNYSLWGLFGPVTWPAWLLALAVLLMWLPDRSARRRALAKAAATAALLLFVAFLALPTGSWLIAPLEARFPRPALDRLRPAHIVVLSGAERLAASEHSGQLEVGYAGDRVLEGAALAHRFPRATLWAIGGIRLPGSRTADIDWTAGAWHRLGIAPGRVRKVDGTRDTCGNAAGYAATRRARRAAVLLVTSAFHMPRAVACFRRAGIEPIPYPVDYNLIRPTREAPSGLAQLQLVDLALHEWIGLAYYRLAGRIDDLFPAPR